MKVGDIIRWETPSGEQLEGRILQVPSAARPMEPQGASMMIVQDSATGTAHKFDAWLTRWEIIIDNPENN